MRKIALIIFGIASFACSVDEVSPTAPPSNNPDLNDAKVERQGVIAGVNHTASGTATLYEMDGTHYVVFDPFMSQNGPDLKVYLSKDVSASEYIRLGNLQSTSGKQTYSIPAGYNPQNYSYVHIWCEKYSVEFARAELK